MKIRTDFVTNSSSVSYLCVNCGYEQAGRDDGFEEFWFKNCAYGHELCDTCTEGVKLDDDDNVPSSECPACMLKRISPGTISSYAKKHYGFDPNALEKEIVDKFARKDGTGLRLLMEDIKDED